MGKLRWSLVVKRDAWFWFDTSFVGTGEKGLMQCMCTSSIHPFDKRAYLEGNPSWR